MGEERQERERVYVELVRLHEDVDREVAVLEELHRDRLVCKRGCYDCCVDELTVFEVEAERIRRAHSALLNEDRPHPVGACAFLDDDGACRIYTNRPYVCRTQGLPLRWMEEREADGEIELRDICPLNDRGRPIEGLALDACWTIGPAEGRLGRLQQLWGEGNMERVPLRALFSIAGRHGS